MPFYAVAHGRKVGVYETWDECKKQTDQFSKPIFKKFSTREEANEFIAKHSTGSSLLVSKAESFASNVSSKSKNNTTYKNTYSNNQSKFVSKETKCEARGLKRKSQPDQVEFDEDGSVIVYTDGACTDNGKWNARAGIGVYWADDHPDNVASPLNGKPTNNRAEIHAAITALKQAKDRGYKSVLIRTDSKFLLDSATKWIHGWMRKGWKLSTGEPVKNEEDFKELIQIMGKLDKVTWQKVAGHRGIYGNEQADFLARKGLSQVPVVKRIKKK